MSLIDYDSLFHMIETLVLYHSPSGAEAEIDQFLMQRLQELGVEAWQDQAGNVIARVSGRQVGRAIAITAHKDEIGGIVKTIPPVKNPLILG
jgi:putative aminopeptidase FrvX